MAIITRIFCDICGYEDGKAYAWFVGPWTKRKGSDSVEFTVCNGCVATVIKTVRGLFVKPKMEGNY